MQRIDTSTKAVDLFGSGKHGFQDGNPSLGIPATQLNAALFNAFQEEIASVVEYFGDALNPSDRAQLLLALRKNTGIGCIGMFPLASAPVGWIKANGAAVSRTAYAALFAVYSTTFGAGDGSTTFNLPDFRGEFPRFLDDGRGIDVGRVAGSAQAQDVQAHNHGLPWRSSGLYFGGTGSSYYAVENFPTGTTSNSTGTETRPRNVALLPCIKY